MCVKKKKKDLNIKRYINGKKYRLEFDKRTLVKNEMKTRSKLTLSARLRMEDLQWASGKAVLEKKKGRRKQRNERPIEQTNNGKINKNKESKRE